VHLTDASPSGFKAMIDQMAVVGGFDMLIFSFGSGFNFENTDPAYLAEIKADVEYANAHGIEVGGYDLISDTRSGTGYDATNPVTSQSEGDACMASAWKNELTTKVMTFVNKTGLSMIETDGPYCGNPCGSGDHDHYGTVRVFEQDFAFEDAIGSHACSLEANIPRDQWHSSRSPLALTVVTINDVETLKVQTTLWKETGKARFNSTTRCERMASLFMHLMGTCLKAVPTRNAAGIKKCKRTCHGGNRSQSTDRLCTTKRSQRRQRKHGSLLRWLITTVAAMQRSSPFLNTFIVGSGPWRHTSAQVTALATEATDFTIPRRCKQW
jgi:hypothetical protein